MIYLLPMLPALHSAHQLMQCRLDAGSDWETIATEAAGTASSAQMRLMSFKSLPEYVKAGDYYVRLEWPGGGFAQFHVPEGSNIFSSVGKPGGRADQNIAVDEV